MLDEERDALLALDGYRRRYDLSFPRLARLMAQAGAPVSARTLHYLIRGRGKRPTERTLIKIQRYNQIVRADEKARVAAAERA